MQLTRITLSRLYSQSTMFFYAVACGRKVGIYNTWPECEQQVKGFKDAKYKKFPTKAEALEFISKHNSEGTNGMQKFDSSMKRANEVKLPHVSKQSKKEYWPPNYCIEDDQMTELDLLAALAEVEGIPDSKISDKYVTHEEDEGKPNPKKRKHESKVWMPIGIKNVRGFDFQIDEEGYVIVYTDGSCFNNGQKGACAGYGVYFGDDHPLNIGNAVTGRATNNVGEIQAAIHAIKIVKDLGITKVRISTDSQFLINSVTLWMKGWKAKNWRLKNGEPVKNVTEFLQLDKLLQSSNINVKWNYVQAHQGSKGNEMADKLAREGSVIYKRIHSNKNDTYS